jgi:hypothetical protein
LSVKTPEEQRQTAEGEVLPTKVTGECCVRRGFVWRGRPRPRKACGERNLRGPTVFAPHRKAIATATATAAGEGARSTRTNTHKQIQ